MFLFPLRQPDAHHRPNRLHGSSQTRQRVECLPDVMVRIGAISIWPRMRVLTFGWDPGCRSAAFTQLEQRTRHEAMALIIPGRFFFSSQVRGVLRLLIEVGCDVGGP